jgi:hypothetical protein
MALAIWVAARTQTVAFDWRIFVGIFGAALLASVFRWLRGAKVADVCDGPILKAFLLTRFAVTPAVFLLCIFAAVAWALRLDVMATLWIAAGYALIYGVQLILLTTFAFELALGIRGGRREPLSAD